MCMQDADSQVRDASCEALSAYAQALAEATGRMLDGSAGIVRAIFDCLAEQKREGQVGASQALLQVRHLHQVSVRVHQEGGHHACSAAARVACCAQMSSGVVMAAFPPC